MREAVARGAAIELLTTPAGHERFHVLLADAVGVRITLLTAEAMERACDMATPQPIAAICRRPPAEISAALNERTKLVLMLVDCQDPGNVGTVVRLTDAVGADGLVLGGNCADPFGPKAVRASAGSIFHVPVVPDVDPDQVVATAAALGIATIAAAGDAAADVFALAAAGALERRTLWLFGNEAHGLASALRARCDQEIAIPIFGHAESLNLAAAAAICLYQSALAQRR